MEQNEIIIKGARVNNLKISILRFPVESSSS